MAVDCIKIGGAAGYWGDADMAVPQFLGAGDVDFIVFDYLAEITMSIMARARAADPTLGYATDFVSAALVPHLHQIAATGTRIISNAGGVNPQRCAEVVREAIDQAGLALTVAVVTGDDLMPQLDSLVAAAPVEMFDGSAFPPEDRVASANAYLGAFPIARALDTGADIVITGRCVDSAVTLGACIHSFGWAEDALDYLAVGSLAGHIIECGAQATGGNYTDWEDLVDTLHEVGYPIAEITREGGLCISKPAGTGGAVTCGTVGEQILYEIGDPRAYVLPDVICDFSAVECHQRGANRVEVSGAKGRGRPEHYKVSVTWADGWRAGAIFYYLGDQAARKAQCFAQQAIARSQRKLRAAGEPDFNELCVETVGNESHYGAASKAADSREVALKVAARHAEKRAVSLLLKELTGAALGAPPGLCMFAGTRPKPSPVIRLFSFLIDKAHLEVDVTGPGGSQRCMPSPAIRPESGPPHPIPPIQSKDVGLVDVPLKRLAFVRSGDKGNKANIGVMARQPAFLPWLAAGLTVECVRERFSHFLTSPAIDRYYLPGLPALNFVLHDALGGGGVASLRNDPQAKCYSQLLLDVSVSIPSALLGVNNNA